MKYITLFFCFLTFSVFTQKKNNYKKSYLKELIKAERKGGLKKMLFQRNINTTNYDVNYHRLELNVNPAQAHITGVVTTYLTALENINSITFDMGNNLTVSSVTQRGTDLSFSTANNNELVITLTGTLNVGVLDSITINYNGNPVTGDDGFTISTHSGTPVLYTLSEPYGAKSWWPCKQNLTDKIDSIDVFISAPLQYTAVSNGLMIAETTNGNTKTTHWKHKYKIPAYLIAIAVTNYSKYSHHVTTGNFNIDNYVYPENLTTAQSQTPITVDIMNLFGNLFELYPFANEKYGHAQFGWGGGMEHTTISFMNNFNRGLIAHELAHQWFGNKVTCGSWEDIWLNEGFATFLSGLVIENLDSKSDFISWKQEKINSITSSPSGSVFCTDTTSIGRIFNSRLSYNKGAMVLQMLRYKLGDTNFFNALKSYLQDSNLAFGYAKTNDLKQHLETTSGQNLTEFFNDWYMGEGYPTYQIDAGINNNSVNITVNQTQSHNSVTFFEMPITFKLEGTSGQEEFVRFENTTNGQIFTYTASFPITNVVFNPNYNIVTKNSTVTLDVKTPILEEYVSIYPNPIKQQFFIKSTIVKIKKVIIYNLLGQLVFTITNPTQQINLQKLKTGVYSFKIITDKGIISKSLLKE